jgi:group I intron endonuclease
VYAIRATFDPTHEYRYVGLTSRGSVRFREHIEDARNPDNPNYRSDKSSWIRDNYFHVTFDTLNVCSSDSEIDFYERMWIDVFSDRGHRLLNKTSGGQRGTSMSPEVRRKLSEARTGKVQTQETKDKISNWWKEYGPRGESHPNFGREISEETRKKMSDAKSGESHWAFGTGGETHYNYGRKHTEETKKKVSEALTGITRSEETRAKMSVSMSGEKNPHFGKPAHNRGIPMSEKTKRKLSESKKGKPNRGRHVRWHANRGITSDDCMFCLTESDT